MAEWLEKASRAANAKDYTRPSDNSALAFIQRAEAEHLRVRGGGSRSKGADESAASLRLGAVAGG